MSSSHPERRSQGGSFVRQKSGQSNPSSTWVQICSPPFKKEIPSRHDHKTTRNIPHLSPSCSPAFPCCPPPLSRGPAEPAAASFCAAGVWCPAPETPTSRQVRTMHPRVLLHSTVQQQQDYFACQLWVNLLNYSAWSHPLQVLLWGLKQRLSRGDPNTSHVHVQTQTLVLQPVTHLILWPACKGSINITEKKHRIKQVSIVRYYMLCYPDRLLCPSSLYELYISLYSRLKTKKTTFRVLLFRLNAQTHLLTCWRSRDQPSLGPAVARTPPRLNSPSGKLSSRVNVVDWLLFNLQNMSVLILKTQIKLNP